MTASGLTNSISTFYVWVTLGFNQPSIFYIYIGSAANSIGDSINIHSIQLEDVTAQSNQAPSEYIPTTSAPVTKCYDYLNPMIVDGVTGVVTDSGVRQSIVDWRGSELITNGDFSADTWNKGTNVSIDPVAKVANFASSPDGTALIQSGKISAGKSYEITYEIKSISSGYIVARVGGKNGVSKNAPGIYSEIITNTLSGYSTVGVMCAGITSATVDTISVKECYPVAKTGIKGLLIEPTKSNKCTCYATIPGDMLGSELVTNGGFDTDTGWNKGAGWTISSGVLNANVSSWSGAAQTITATTGKMYKYSLTATIISGSINLYLGTADTDNKIFSTAGTNTFTGNIRCGSGTSILNLASFSFVGTIDNVSIKEVILAAGTTANSLNPTAITNMTFSGYNQTSGNLVVGVKYKITARTTLDFTTCGAANNTVGTVFTATSAGTLGTGDSVDNQSVSLSIVDDTTNMTAAKLLSLNPSGKVYKLDNSLGASVIYSIPSGSTNGLTTHSDNVIARITQGTGKLQTSMQNFSPIPSFSGSSFVKYVGQGLTSINTGETLLIRADAGSIIYFIMPQLEECPVCTSLIPSQGGSAPRASIITSIPTPAKPVCGVLEWTYGGSTGAPQYLWCSSLDINNLTGLYFNYTCFDFVRKVSGVSTVSQKIITGVVGTSYKVGWRINTNGSLDIFINGAKGATQTNSSATNWGSTIHIGCKNATPEYPTLGQIKNKRWFNKPLSDLQMCSLTS